MSVTLTNTSGRLQSLDLPHQSSCHALGRCACTNTSKRQICHSLTLPAGTSKAGLPEAILAVPAVAFALVRGRLRLTRRQSAHKRKAPDRKPARRSGRKRRGNP